MGESVETVIDSIRNVPWGTHFCHFYRTKEDLISILVPYFQAGLEDNEFCVWVTAKPLVAEEARKSMEKAMPGFARYVESGQIEIVPHDQWYLKDGVFDSERVIHGWAEKLDSALAAGYSGMRASGNMSWVGRNGWRQFLDYEAAIDRIIGQRKMVALCTLWVERIGAAEIVEASSHHASVIVSRDGRPELVESAFYRKVKEAEEALRVSEEKYRRLVDSAADGIAVIQDGEMVFANPRVIEVIGGSQAEQIARPIMELIHPDDQQIVAKRLLETVNGEGRSGSYSFRVLDKEARTRWVETSMVLFNWNERPAVLCHLTDVTEQKLMQENLKASEEKNRLLIETANEGILVMQDDKVIFCNPKYLEIAGFAEEEVVSRSFIEHVHPDDRQILTERYLKRMRGEKISPSYAARVIDKAGNVKWVEASSVLFTWNGRPAILALVTDVTERKKVEEVLEQHNRSLATTNALAIELASLPSREISEAFVTKRLAEMTGAAAVWFTEYDPGDRTLVLRHLEMETELREKVARLLGKQPNEVRSPVSEDMYSEIVSNVIGKRQTLTEVSFGAIPPSVGTAIQELMGVDHFIGIAYVIDGELYGTSLLAMRAGRPDPARELLESIAHMVAISLRQRHAEDALRQSEERYRFMAENISDVIWVIDMNLRTTYISPSITRMTGYSVEETMARGMGKGLTPAATEAISEIVMAEVARKGEPNGATRLTPVAVEIEHKDGSKIWAESAGTLLRDSDGQPVGIIGILRDITEHKRAEDALRASEERFRAIFEKSPVGIVVYDRSGIAVAWNKVCRDIFGLPDVKGASTLPLFEDPFVSDEARQALRMGKTLSWEGPFDLDKAREAGVYHAAKSGTIYLRGMMAALGNGNRESPGGYIALVEDISERKRMEEQLQRQERYFRALIERSSDVVAVLGKDGIARYVSPTVEQMLGITRVQAESGGFMTSVHPDDVQKVAEDWSYLMEHPGCTTKGERRVQHADGTWRYVEAIGYSLLHDPAVAGIVVNIRDITERKRVEDALQVSEEKFSKAFHASPAMMAIVSLKDGRYAEVNKAYERITGYCRDEVVGHTFSKLALWANPQEIEQTFQKLVVGESHGNLEAHFRTKTSSQRVGLLSAEVFEFAGENCVLIVVEDVTESREAERKGKKVQEELALSSRLSSLGRLASGVAHEINNPLSAVIGYSQILMEKDVPEGIKGDLRVINDNAQRVAKVVKGLLAFGRQNQLGREYVDINTIVSEVIRLRAHEMSIQDIEVATKFAPDLPWTMVDVGQIQQVFLNIVLNAEQAMTRAHKGGHLEIRTGSVGDSIRISFKDDGPGMAKEDLAKMFDPFFTTKGVGEGTGLGLSISYGIIKEHNGRIYARGEIGKGVTFVVELPIVAEPDQPEVPNPAKEPGRRMTGRILVVDDEPALCQMLSQLLTREGHSVETVSNANAALEKLTHGRFSLILLDIIMKGTSGIEMYKQMAKIAPALQERVVFITGDTLAPGTRNFLEKTKAPYVCKPFDIKELRERVNQMLREGRTRSSSRQVE